MRVERFSLFFGPMLVKFRRGETEYGIGPIPLGGYVKITGMNPHEEIPPEVVPRAYFNQPVWKRIVVILAGPAVNLLIAFLILFGRLPRPGVDKTSHGQLVSSTTVAPGAFEPPGSYYLKAGDRIVAVDGRRDLSVARIRSVIASHRCAGPQVNGCQAATPVSLVVRRDGHLLHFSIRPRYHSSDHRMLIGFAFAPAVQQLGPVSSAGHSVNEMWYVTKTTVSTVARIFEPKERKQLHGSVGAFKITQQVFAYEHDPGAADLGPDFALVGGRQPLPLPPARRRSRLLGARREGPRPAHSLLGHGEGRRGRVRADHPGVRDRAFKRHLDADGVGVQCPLARRRRSALSMPRLSPRRFGGPRRPIRT